MTKDWKKDLEQQIEEKTGTKDFARAAQDNALLQRIAELEMAWLPLMDHLAYIGQTYQAEEKVLKACFDADKKDNSIKLFIGFAEEHETLKLINSELAFKFPHKADDHSLNIISWNGFFESGKDTYKVSETDMLIQGINKYIAEKIAHGNLQKRHVRKDINLSPKL